jgi:hypothetical protein
LVLSTAELRQGEALLRARLVLLRPARLLVQTEPLAPQKQNEWPYRVLT